MASCPLSLTIDPSILDHDMLAIHNHSTMSADTSYVTGDSVPTLPAHYQQHESDINESLQMQDLDIY